MQEGREKRSREWTVMRRRGEAGRVADEREGEEEYLNDHSISSHQLCRGWLHVDRGEVLTNSDGRLSSTSSQHLQRV